MKYLILLVLACFSAVHSGGPAADGILLLIQHTELLETRIFTVCLTQPYQ